MQDRAMLRAIKKLENGFMKAIVYREYGSPDVLKMEQVEKPAPEDNEVLIKVCAGYSHNR
jgi:hypothetical protein